MAKTRKQPYGNRNLIGKRVEDARKREGIKQKDLLARLLTRGVEINASGLSKLEGQIRYVTDIELVAIADALGVSISYLLGKKEKEDDR